MEAREAVWAAPSSVSDWGSRAEGLVGSGEPGRLSSVARGHTGCDCSGR